MAPVSRDDEKEDPAGPGQKGRAKPADQTPRKEEDSTETDPPAPKQG